MYVAVAVRYFKGSKAAARGESEVSPLPPGDFSLLSPLSFTLSTPLWSRLAEKEVLSG